jgi:predicted phage baseplate assembly protein
MVFAAIRNPLPASGGAAPEDVEKVKLLAPYAFRNLPMRAASAGDYEALAVRLEPSLQRAKCSLIPSGGRQLARIAIDPMGNDAPDEGLARRLAIALEPFRRVGHDIIVVRGEYVPLLLVMRVALLDGYRRRHLRAALREALGDGVSPEGRRGAFHPDNLTFGSPIYTSRLIAAAQALEGVGSVSIVELARLFDRERGVLERGILHMDWNEIPQLDNDPLRPDQGRFVLHLTGGLE